jgi:ribosomal protein L21E
MPLTASIQLGIPVKTLAGRTGEVSQVNRTATRIDVQCTLHPDSERTVRSMLAEGLRCTAVTNGGVEVQAVKLLPKVT